MAENRAKATYRNTDEAGVRLAPNPIDAAPSMLQPLRQEMVIQPKLVLNDPGDTEPHKSTEKDYQPLKEDMRKRYKRTKRGKNMLAGILMLIATAAVVVPFVLGAVGVNLNGLPFKYVPERFNSIRNVIEAFKATAELNWKGDIVKEIWLMEVPDLMLIFGLLMVAINMIKAIFGVFGAVKPRRYLPCATIYLAMVLALLVASLVGAPAIGVEKIDFMQDFIHGYKTSELFSLIVFAAGYTLVAAVASLIHTEKYGYLR